MPIRAGATPVVLKSGRRSGVAVGGQGSFDPRSISTLTGWYDFSDATTLFTDTGRATAVSADADLIGSVTDKSGGSRHLTRGGIAGTEPVYKTAIQNGRSISRFNGSKWLVSGATFAADTAQTIICVALNGGGSTLMSPWSRSDNNNNRLSGSWNNGSNALGMFVGTGAGSYQEQWTSATASWVVVSCLVNNTGAVSVTFGDGTQRSSATGVPGITCSLLFAIGSRQPTSLTSGFNSDIGEVLTFNTNLAATDRVAVETMLKSRWATA